MGEKGHGGATTVPERDERVRFAVTRLCTSTSDVDSVTAIAEKFGCSRRTATRYLRAGKRSIGAGLPAEIEGWRTLVRSTLLWLLEHDTEPTGMRSTLKQITDLLGLAAPTRAEIYTAPVPYDMIGAYAADPELRDRALQLERDIYNAGETLGAVDTGEARVPGMAVPSAPAKVGGNGHAAVDRSKLQPPDNPDPG